MLLTQDHKSLHYKTTLISGITKQLPHTETFLVIKIKAEFRFSLSLLVGLHSKHCEVHMKFTIFEVEKVQRVNYKKSNFKILFLCSSFNFYCEVIFVNMHTHAVYSSTCRTSFIDIENIFIENYSRVDFNRELRNKNVCCVY